LTRGAVAVAPTLTVDSAVGSPSPGSLKMTATFTDYNQYVDAIINLSPVINLTGKTLHASLQLTSGTFQRRRPSCTVGRVPRTTGMARQISRWLPPEPSPPSRIP